MAAPSPSLSLSDIILPLSPPLVAVQQKGSSPPPHARSITPEPLGLAEIEDMRRRILSITWVDSPKGQDTTEAKPQELIDMLLRLTHPPSLPQPSQLHAQAETIAHLIQQRDFLVKRSTEDQERWESERESWARAAHALIAQGRRMSMQADKDDAMVAQYALVTADASTQRMQEFERANINLQNDKKSLQQKLAETQRRLALLESELAQLKPLLLMQPFALTHSHPTGTAFGWSAVLPGSSSTPASRHEKERDRRLQDVEEEEEVESDDEMLSQPLQSRPQFRNPAFRLEMHEGQLVSPMSPGSPSKPKVNYYRHRELHTPYLYYPSAQLAKPGRRKTGTAGHPDLVKPVLSDARAEHLLLAARKIGRRRATYLSGTFANSLQSESPSHYKHKGASTSQSQSKLQQSPRTPRRNANANANTPLLTRTPLGQPGSTTRTPLQSLLSAAQSVLSAPGSTSPTDASPSPKRRRIEPPTTVIKNADAPPVVRSEREKEKTKRAPLVGGIARVRSALDFLADQAEVYSTQPPSQGSVDSGGSPPKDIEEPHLQDVEMEDSDSTHRGVLRRGKEKVHMPGSRSRPTTPIVDDVDLLQHPRSDSHRDTKKTTAEESSLQHSQHRDEERNIQTFSPVSGPAKALAPPIDLIMRTSRSPAPQRTGPDPHNSRKRSRSSSTDQDITPAANTPIIDTGSFSTPSLRDTQVADSAITTTNRSIELDQCQAEGSTSKIVESVKPAADVPPRRTRSPYIKWTKEEDELLAKAVATHGQKWDLVQKALPSRGYHQVRQRWLRKLGVFDGNKLDLASLETNAAAEFLNLSTAPPTNNHGRPTLELRSTPNMKLGLAPLNSEKVLTGSSGSSARRSLSPFPTSGPSGAVAGFPFPVDGP